MNKRLLSLILTIVMIFGCVPFGALHSFAVDSPKISVISKYAAPNSTVQVDLKITNNPGIAGAKITLAYDSKLTLTDSASIGVFSVLDYTKPGAYSSPCNFNWDSESAVSSGDGTFLTLTFKVSSTAKQNESLPITITYRNGDIYNGSLNSVNATIENGAITVIDYIPGDVNGDKTVNGKDVTLIRRYNAGGYDVSINEAAADVNDDDVINGKDVTLIRRFNAGGYDVELKHHTPRCEHEMTATKAVAATCDTEGNIAYWHCSKCDKYFSDANGSYEIALSDTVVAAKGHTVVVDPEIPATYTSTGLTAGSHCSVCNKVLVQQQIIPMLQKTQYSISYVVSSNDEYLAKQSIANPNPTSYTAEDGLRLQNLQVEGYVFDGWYDAEGLNGELVKQISKGTTGSITLYARWSLKQYKVQFDSPLVPVAAKTYTVNEGITLSTPSLSGYNFVGWCDENDKLVTSISEGNTGNKTLYANWTSKRNQTRPVSQLSDPIVLEDVENGEIFFTYEIGTVENIPLSQISDMYQSTNGLKQTFTTSESATTSKTSATAIANSISNATTSSKAWTLSKEWNDIVTVSESYANQQGWTKEEAETNSKTSSDTYSLNSSRGGASTTVTNTGLSGTLSSETSNTSSGSVSASRETGSEFDVDYHNSTTVGLSGEVSGRIGVAKGKIGANLSNTYDVGASSKNYSNNQRSATLSRSNTGTNGNSLTVDYTKSTSGSSSWNTSSGYSSSNTTANSKTVATVLSGVINEVKGYGSSYATGGSNSENQAFSTSENETNQYSSTISYDQSSTSTNTKTIELGGENEGYYRFVLAGTAHVFAVVGYNIANRVYYVYTYSVMDNNTYTFIDYSKNTPNFNDYENGVLPFEVPYYVHQYVDYRTDSTEGLQINTTTGTIDAYNGTAKTVWIPAYMSVDNIDGNGHPGCIKVTGLAEGIFKNKTNLEAVSIGSYITKIPQDAFSGCSNLISVIAPGVKSIGSNAFKSCSKLSCFSVPSTITSIGSSAFNGVNTIEVDASTESVADYSASSGAKNVTLNISSLSTKLVNKTLTLPQYVDYFELRGGNKEFNGLQIVTKSKSTYLNGIRIKALMGTPLAVSSNILTLNGVSITSDGFGMKILDETVVKLRQDNAITSSSGKAVLCKSTNLTVADSSVTGKLILNGDMYCCGTVSGSNNITFTSGEIIYLTESEYEKYLNGMYTLNYDANGGSVSESSKTIYYGEAIGSLPTPTRTGFTFDGWYTAKSGGTKITETTVSAFDANTTIYAHWTVNSYTAKWNTGTGYTITVKRTSSPNKGAATGNISSGATVYYGDVLSVTYTASTGFTIATHGVASVTVTGNVTSSTIYATASVNSYTASWSTGTGYTITVNRTSSPNKGAATGAISNGSAIYYGDVLSITYTASTGYTLKTKGSMSITVTGNVTSSSIYATAAANSYTYNIVYKSSNGTDLGSSTATYNYGTTNSISAPAKDGYNTPGSQSVNWDSTSAKTITFIYTPIERPTRQVIATGNWWKSSSGNTSLDYVVEAEWRNRTADSIEIRVIWTNTITNPYNQGKYGYKQEFEWWDWHQIASASEFNTAGGTRTASNSSGWHTYPCAPGDTSRTIGSEWRDNNGKSGTWSGTVYFPKY